MYGRKADTSVEMRNRPEKSHKTHRHLWFILKLFETTKNIRKTITKTLEKLLLIYYF